MAPLITDQMPLEGNEVVVTGPVIGSVRGYFVDGAWWEAVDGPDILLVGLVVSWDLIPPPPPAQGTP